MSEENKKAEMPLLAARILDFMSHFGITRPGFYNVARHVLERALLEYLDTGSMRALQLYEVFLYDSWDDGDAPGRRILSENDCALVASMTADDRQFLCMEFGRSFVADCEERHLIAHAKYQAGGGDRD